MLSQPAMFFARGVSFVLGGDPAELLLLPEGALAHRVPAVVEPALVLVRPLRRDVVRPVAAAGRPVHEEGLVGREGAVALEPGERLLRHVLGQVVLLVVGRLDDVRVLHEAGLPLGGLAGEEPVEVVEAVAGGPVGEGAHRGRLVGRRVVPLAERGGLVAVVAEDLGDGGGRLRHDAGVAVPVDGALGDGARADALVVAPGQESGARGRADRRGVEPVVPDPLVGEAAEGRRVDRAAEGVGGPEAHVVDQDDQDVRRVLGEVVRLDAPLHGRFLERPPGHAGRGRRRERKDGPVGRRRGGGLRGSLRRRLRGEATRQ